MKILFAAIAGLLAIITTSPATAQSVENFELNTAQDLLDVCSPPSGDPSTDVALAYCYGYIVGGADLYARLVEAKAIEAWACAEPTPSLNEVRVAFVNWANTHTASLGGHPADAFWEAMTAAFPCDR